MKGWAVLPLIVLGQVALAAGPDSSQRPVPRYNEDTLPLIVVPSGAIEQPKRDPAARAAAEGGRGMETSLRPALLAWEHGSRPSILFLGFSPQPPGFAPS